MPSIQPFAWRHFCLNNADINVTVDIHKGGYILIPDTYRIQGTKPVNQANIILLGIQGGFLCTHEPTSFPSQGTLYNIGNGWFYVPNANAHKAVQPPPIPNPDPTQPPIIPPIPDDDSFMFALSYMGQYSPINTVHITFG